RVTLERPSLLRLRAARERCFALDIEGARLGGRAAPHGDSGDRDFPLDVALHDRERIADLHVARGLRSLPGHTHVSALDRVCRDTARLEEAGVPEPTVDAYRFRFQAASSRLVA